MAMSVPRRPGWITLVIIFVVLSSADSLWNFPGQVGRAPLQASISLVEAIVSLAAAVGLWRMKAWGAVLFAAGAVLSLLVLLPLQVLQTPIYLKSPALPVVVIVQLVLYFLIFRGLWFLWRDGALT
jgi:hypothetical protein